MDMALCEGNNRCKKITIEEYEIMDHWEKQKKVNESTYKRGSRAHVDSQDLIVRYLVQWRLLEGIKRLNKVNKGMQINSSILVLCSGEGYEGSILSDMGFTNVTVSDISAAGVAAAKARDTRLKSIVLNAEQPDVLNDSYDFVLIQDGLHHLQSPVRGFTEMLRVAKYGVMFLEPHESFMGRLIGTKWEHNGDAINYVFRWNKRLVEDVASSYLGRNQFVNSSFSFWHHNIIYAKLAKLLGNGVAALFGIKSIKRILDVICGRMGNSFCAIIVKPRTRT